MKCPKGASKGHHSSSDALTMPISVVVPEKRPGIWCDIEEETEEQYFFAVLASL